MVRLLKHWMVASKQFTQFNHVVITLSHLLPINRDHIIVQPITCGCFMIAYGTLRYFTFMMRELQIHSATMNIKLFAKIFCTHRRTLYVPSRKTFTPHGLCQR